MLRSLWIFFNVEKGRLNFQIDTDIRVLQSRRRIFFDRNDVVYMFLLQCGVV